MWYWTRRRGAGGIEQHGEGQVGGGLGGGDGVEGEAGLRGEGLAGAGEAHGDGAGGWRAVDSGRVRKSGERVLRTAVMAFFWSSGETILVIELAVAAEGVACSRGRRSV